MELRQIIYFMEVAKREHVTEAADQLHVAQSAISRQISKLEEELGVDLFIREGRNVRLAPVGQLFLTNIEKAIQAIDHAVQVVEEYTDPEKGTIRIGFPSSLASFILPSAISKFREHYPSVNFDLIQGSYYELKDAVVHGDMNMAILGPVPTNDKQLQGKILFTEKIVALVPRNHPLASRSSLTLHQLREDSFILFPNGYILRQLIEEACKQEGFQPRVAFEGKDIDGIKGLVSAGLGVSLVPEITLLDNIPRSTVKIPLADSAVMRTVGIIISKHRKLLPTERIFYDFLVEFFKRLEEFQN